MPGRQSDPIPATSPALSEADPDQSASKGRPTPKRKDAEAANKRPLVPSNRKGAAKSSKSAQRDQRNREYQAMRSGDEKSMPAKDRGPVRRYMRDYVDARRNLGELFLPIAFIFLVLQFTVPRSSPLGFFVLVALYIYVLVSLLDGYLMWRGVKKRVTAKFGANALLKGSMMYCALRAFQIRPARLPKPQAKHGQYPS